MSITYELRAMLNMTESINTADIQDLYEIADRIDEQVAKMYEDLTIGMEPMDAEHMAEHGWVKLPVDADGVPIHVGDEVKLEHSGRVTTVTNINYNKYGWQVYCAEGGGFDKDTRFRHVHPDTWESIIEDAIDTAFEGVDDESEFDLKKMELVDRCRRLAGER